MLFSPSHVVVSSKTSTRRHTFRCSPQNDMLSHTFAEVFNVCVCVVSRLAQHVLRRKFPKQNIRSSTGRRAAPLILTDYPTSVLSPFTLSFSASLAPPLSALGLLLVSVKGISSLLSHTYPNAHIGSPQADCWTTTPDHKSAHLPV